MAKLSQRLVVLLAGTLFLAGGVATAQKNDKAESDKDRKIRELESRLERLEKIVFATSKLSILDAERQLTRAKQQFEHSERLFIRGLLTDAQIAQDRFELQLAERELSLAKNTRNAQRVSMEIDVMRAKNSLRVAKDNFKRSERLGNRGFGSLTQIDNSRRQIAVAEKRLELAQMQLDAISKSIKKSGDNSNQKNDK